MKKLITSFFVINNDKSLIKRFVKGLIKGFNMPLLPENIMNFHNNPIIRIFRVVGGISYLICLLKLYGNYLILFFIISLLYVIYVVFIGLTKIIYLIILWRNGKLEVRNSPLDRLATLAVSLAGCVKGVCTFSFTAGTVLGLGASIDTLLTMSGRDAVFTPLAARILDDSLNKLGLDNPNVNFVAHQNNVDVIKYKINRYNYILKELEELDMLKLDSKNCELVEIIKNELKDEFFKEQQKLKEIQSSILEALKDSNNKKK